MILGSNKKCPKNHISFWENDKNPLKIGLNLHFLKRAHTWDLGVKKGREDLLGKAWSIMEENRFYFILKGEIQLEDRKKKYKLKKGSRFFCSY